MHGGEKEGRNTEEYMKVTSEMKEKEVIIKNLVRGVGFGAALSPRMLGCC